MSHKFLFNASFHSLLNKIDHELAEEVHKKGCACGGRLHKANYPRSPFGLPAAFRSDYEQRISFCCDTCRKRTTPPSVRFFGRRWFPAPLFILISLLMSGINDRRLAQVKHHFGIAVSESTWKRWRRWWRESFATTKFWQLSKGLVAGMLDSKLTFPRSLWCLFSGELEERVQCLLQFLAPLTGGNLRAV
jgi:hypothetical protein